MKKDFDFSNIGKREPFTVPEHFFENLQAKIEQDATQTRKPRIFSWKVIMSSAASVAAVAAIIFTVGFRHSNATVKKYSLETVEQSFAQLCEADQQYLIETYQEDIFLNN